MKPPRLVRGSTRAHQSEPEIEWREYPRIPPGEYFAYCKFAKRYRDPGFQRWTCLIRWDVLKDDLETVVATIPMWIPLGSEERPRASRRGNYLKEWVSANGGPPLRGDRLSPQVFTGRMARVEVGDTDPKKSPVPYSVVRRIVSWETGGNGVTLSASHTVKEGRHKGCPHIGFQRVIGRFVSRGPSRGRGWKSLQHTPKGRAFRWRIARQRQEVIESKVLHILYSGWSNQNDRYSEVCRQSPPQDTD